MFWYIYRSMVVTKEKTSANTILEAISKLFRLHGYLKPPQLKDPVGLVVQDRAIVIGFTPLPYTRIILTNLANQKFLGCP